MLASPLELMVAPDSSPNKSTNTDGANPRCLQRRMLLSPPIFERSLNCCVLMQVLRPAVSTLQFRGLDALRCYAALAVVVYHATLGLTFFSKAPAMLLHNLPIGVDFFF